MGIQRNRAADFAEFVKRQQVSLNGETDVDWAKEREEWLDHLATLYQSIELFLKDYLDQGAIRISYRAIDLNEEEIGHYTAREMMIQIGRQQVTLIPIGTMLIGTKGRVDVEGTAGRGRLVLKDKRSTRPEIHKGKVIEWVWKISTPPPSISYLDLTKESFFDLLMEVTNG